MALLPPDYLNAVLAIGIKKNEKNINWIGSSFLYGLKEDNESYTLWLITNKHVLEQKKQIYVRFNALDETKCEDYPINLFSSEEQKLWFEHDDKDIDVAAIPIDPNFLKGKGRKFVFFESDHHVYYKEDLKNFISEGDRVFVLGFPLGYVGELKQYTFCRTGIFSRVRDYLENKSNQFVLDALIFPGNSGGPVITCPSALKVVDTKNVKHAKLVGIIKSYIPFQDIAISRQTGSPKIEFTENSGLSFAESSDSILTVVQSAKIEIKKRGNKQLELEKSGKENM